VTRDPLELKDTFEGEVTDKLGGTQNMLRLLEGHGVERKIYNAPVVSGHAGRAKKSMVKVKK